MSERMQPTAKWCRAIALATAVAALAPPPTWADAEPDTACDISESASLATLTTLIAPRVYLTDDGRRIRLSDISGLSEEDQRTLVGHRFAIALLSDAPDRHGILPAYLSHPTRPAIFLQSELVARGRAWVAPDTLSSPAAALGTAPRPDRRTPCLEVLFEAEASARAARRRAERSPPRLEADDAAAISRHRAGFVVVAGKPRRISTYRGRIYLNFGRSWRTDATVVVPEAIVKAWPDWSERIVSDVKGAAIEARGWVSLASGPLVTIAHPSAIRFDAAAAERQPATGIGDEPPPSPGAR